MSFRGHFLSLSVALALGMPAFAEDGSLEELVEQARAAMAGSRWEQALELNTQVVERFGQDPPQKKYGAQFGAVFHHKGVCEMKLKKWQDAIRSFEICYRDFPNQGVDRGNAFQKLALLKWGEAAMGAEEWELALSRFAKFRNERDPKRDEFPRGAFHINLAVCHYKLGQLPEGSENLEIAIHNKSEFPTPDTGIVAGFQGLVEAAIASRDEQAMLDFIRKNRGALIIDPVEMERFSGVFLKLAGDALTAGMQRAALAIYPFVPDSTSDSTEAVKLAAIALIHEKNGNLRGAYAAYWQLERWFPGSANRENHLYHLVRTATLVGEAEAARTFAGRLARDFPASARLAEIRDSGIEIPEDEAATPTLTPAAVTPVAKVFPRSPEFDAAIDLYEGRKYREALAAFTELQARHQASTPADADAAVLAGFYRLECLRKAGDLEGLAKAMKSVRKDPSLGARRLGQLEINALWDAVRTRSWDRIEALAEPLSRQFLPGDQRAQVAYCQGLAFENTGRRSEALQSYHHAMTADAGASEEITRDAALHVLGIHRADPEVQAALSASGTAGEDRNSAGFRSLKEAAAVARLFEMSLGAEAPLPAECKEFLRFAADGLDKLD